MSTVMAQRCTPHTPRCRDARLYDAELRPCCRQHLIDISRDVSEAFGRAGLTYWMDYGTLLGAFRNPLTTWADYPWLPQDGRAPGPLAPGIVPHDKDADWGVEQHQWAAVLAALKGECRQYHILIRTMADSVKIALSSANRTNLDLFAWYEKPRGSGRMHRKRYIMSVDRFKGKQFDRADLFPLQPLEWEGLQLPAPKDPEAWLEFRYGPNWHTPIAANHDGVSQ